MDLGDVTGDSGGTAFGKLRAVVAGVRGNAIRSINQANAAKWAR